MQQLPAYVEPVTRRDWLTRSVIATVGASLPWWSPLFAEDSDVGLPADGSWVRYRVTNKRDGDDSQTEGTDVFSLVGSVTENDQKCRWFERKSVWTVDDGKQIDILKFLIPERELLEGERPLNSLVRAWQKLGDAQAEPLLFDHGNDVRGHTGSADFAFGWILMLMFRGPERNWKPVHEKRVIEYERGRLDVRAGRGAKHEVSRASPRTGIKVNLRREIAVWSHPSIPFGGAAVKMRQGVEVDDALSRASVREWTIEDFGTDAKSALPENK